MAHSYRTLQHWNQWLTQQFLGNHLLDAEKKTFSQLLKQHFGKHALLLGVPQQYDLLTTTAIPCHWFVSPLISQANPSRYIESDFHELPITTGSIDLVVLPHTLEFIDNPRQLLLEACRIIKPEGLIVICGFNPYSMWGIKKIFPSHKKTPWLGNFHHLAKIKNWLKLADFAMEKQTSILFRPPMSQQNLYNKLLFMENLGSKCLPMLGGVYILLARAKVIPLTPIRLKWKQQLNNIRIPSTMTGNIARQPR